MINSTHKLFFTIFSGLFYSCTDAIILSFELDPVTNINVNFGGANVIYRLTDMKLVVDEISLDGERAEKIQRRQSLLTFSDTQAPDPLISEVRVGTYNQLSIVFGVANENLAEDVDEPLLLGRSMHIEGLIDDDSDGIANRQVIIDVIVPTSESFANFSSEVDAGFLDTIFDGKEEDPSFKININTQTLFNNIDFAEAQDEAGILVIRDDIAQTANAATTLQNNFLQTMTLVFEQN